MAMAYEHESIYNLIPREYHAHEKAPRHTSKFRGNVSSETKANLKGHKTLGQAKVPLRGPEEFLRKREGEPKLPAKTAFKYDDDSQKRPPVPRAEDAPVMGIKTNKNFITQNAVSNIMSVPKRPEKNHVDTKKGDKQPLELSGLAPKYVNKKDYGETPEYLAKRNAEIKKAQEEYDAYVAEHFRRGAMQQLSREEREAILDGLKSNWEKIHHEYQGLSVVTDTAPKKHRKERMENGMKQLERDIEMIEKHTTIYIAN